MATSVKSCSWKPIPGDVCWKLNDTFYVHLQIVLYKVKKNEGEIAITKKFICGQCVLPVNQHSHSMGITKNDFIKFLVCFKIKFFDSFSNKINYVRYFTVSWAIHIHYISQPATLRISCRTIEQRSLMQVSHRNFTYWRSIWWNGSTSGKLALA
jgi:hypothetical protein